MANCLPPPGAQKIPVVLILLDSSFFFFMVWDQVPSLCRELLVDSSGLSPKPLVGYITYGPSGSVHSPVFLKRFFVEDAHELLGSPNALGIGHTVYSSGMAVLEGCAAAIEMFDEFQSRNKVHQEVFSYHLWHFAAEKPDRNMRPIWNDSPALANLTWKTLPEELKTRNINYSIFVVQGSPIFELFTTNPDARRCTVKSIFYTIPLDPSLGQRSDDRWLGILRWGDTATAIVFASDSIGGSQPLAATWPDVLSLECIGSAVSITDFHRWTKGVTVRPAMMRFRPVLKNDNDFGQLVEFLRVRNCYAVASWVLPGNVHATRNLLMRPAGRHLLGAVFPVSGIPAFPPSPQQWV
ncbi:hypothetical protein BGW80DRAFT_1560787 [Lactifluus volemus]|nr:hypothetical protein BGW80DRAFT_1560787 [Lactifluus volemus]